MKKNYILSILFLLLMVGSSANSADVKNISFSYQPGYTVASIEIDGTIRFTHQTEIAKDGKPFRVIVDILSAKHKLGAKTFLSLPNCAVQGLRTSQFAVSPEKVVRLVFDMSSETIYRIETEKNLIKVLFPDKKSQSFANWSTREFLAQKKSTKASASKQSSTKKVATKPISSSSSKTVASINSNIESDRQESLQGKTSSKTSTKSSSVSKKATTPVVVKKPVVANKSKDHYGSVLEKSDMSPTILASTPSMSTKKESSKPSSSTSKATSNAKVEKKPVVVAKAQPKAEVKSTPKTKVEKKTVVVGKTQPKSEVKSTPKATKSSKSSNSSKSSKVVKPQKKMTPKKTTFASNDKAKTSKKSSKSSAIASKKSSKKSQTTVASKSKVEKSSKKATSRFRRSSAKDRKIKGTMVAEFPKRLVIKYKKKSRRDPFETLVNAAKINNSIVNKRLPNVEGLSLVGVIESDSGKNRALFEDKNGYGYILKAGDKVLKGYVLRVKNDRVYFQIFEYGWSRTVALNLE